MVAFILEVRVNEGDVGTYSWHLSSSISGGYVVGLLRLIKADMRVQVLRCGCDRTAKKSLPHQFNLLEVGSPAGG